MHYIGSSENFKSRYSVHKSSINNPKDKVQNHTTLSTYVHSLKDKNIPIEFEDIKWSIISRGHPFSSGGRACDLCLTEKLKILMADKSTTLNKRDELLETCRHRRKHLLTLPKAKTKAK